MCVREHNELTQSFISLRARMCVFFGEYLVKIFVISTRLPAFPIAYIYGIYVYIRMSVFFNPIIASDDWIRGLSRVSQ